MYFWKLDFRGKNGNPTKILLTWATANCKACQFLKIASIAVLKNLTLLFVANSNFSLPMI